MTHLIARAQSRRGIYRMEAEKKRFNLDRIRAEISMVDLYGREVGPARRAGSGWSGLCPFHEERSGSFSMRLARDGWRGHCFGCGWDGSIFDFVMGLSGCDFAGAVERLAGMLGLAPESVERIGQGPKRVAERPRDVMVKPWMPGMEGPTDEELAALAALRGLQVPGLRAAVGDGMLKMADWPWVNGRGGAGFVKSPEAVRSWVVRDPEGWVAQYRRLDGGLYSIGFGPEARESKSWSTRNVAWPVGASGLGDRWRVVLVEGSPDVLAAYHFLWGFGLLGEVAVCGVLGAANRMAEEAVGFFKDKEVRIFAHADVEKNGVRTGWKGAARWQEQLARAGAVVSVANLDGLTMRSGDRVKDVNDLVFCSRDLIEDEVAPLFSEWGL